MPWFSTKSKPRSFLNQITFSSSRSNLLQKGLLPFSSIPILCHFLKSNHLCNVYQVKCCHFLLSQGTKSMIHEVSCSNGFKLNMSNSRVKRPLLFQSNLTLQSPDHSSCFSPSLLPFFHNQNGTNVVQLLSCD